ncbi:hypothetical protein CMI37_24810 [Candidatus Pacearchaeota archaeon]|nr:hypothetical protein [Candidatus Pacearchaeota archaeon]
MSADVELDTYRFNRVLEQLRSFTGADFKKIIRFEANAMLSTAMENTKAGTASYIDERYTYSAKKKPSKRLVPFVYLRGKRVRTRSIKHKGMMVTLKSGREVWKPNRVNPQWKQMQDKLKVLKAKKKARRGMAKASWLYIAARAKLGKLKKTKPFIRKALGKMTSNMKAKLNGQDVGKAKYILEIKNKATLPMIKSGGKRKGPGGYKAFKEAFHGRSQYFYVNLSKGVFKKASAVKSKYKGFEITPLKKAGASDKV